MRSPLIGDGGVAGSGLFPGSALLNTAAGIGRGARDGDGDADGDAEGDVGGLATAVALAGSVPNDPNGTKSVCSRFLMAILWSTILISLASWLCLRRCCRLPFRTIGGFKFRSIEFCWPTAYAS